MLAHARRHLDTALTAFSAPRYYVAGLLKRLFSCPVPIWCQAISFKVLMTLLPLILLATGVFGLVLRRPEPFEDVARYLREFLPPEQSTQLIALVFELQKASGALTFVGAAFFLVAVLTLLGTVRYVVGQAIGGHDRTFRSIPQGYAFDLRMAAQVGLLFVLSFGLTFAINTLSVQTTAWGREAGLDPDTLQRGWAVIIRGVALLVPWLLSVAMFAQLFYFVPRPKPPLRSALVGAAVTAVLFELAKNGFTFYARYLSGVDRYADAPTAAPPAAPAARAPAAGVVEGVGAGAVEAVGAGAVGAVEAVGAAGAAAGEGGLGGLVGVFGLIVILGFWVYLSALTLVVGAMTVSLHEQRHQPHKRVLRRLWRRLQRRGSKPRARASAAAPGTAPGDALGDAPSEARPHGDGAAVDAVGGTAGGAAGGASTQEPAAEPPEP